MNLNSLVPSLSLQHFVMLQAMKSWRREFECEQALTLACDWLSRYKRVNLSRIGDQYRATIDQHVCIKMGVRVLKY